MADTGKKPIKINPVEKVKAEKDGLDVIGHLEEYVEAGWENVEKSDIQVRLKWIGIFFRPVTPNKFMLRLRVSGGLMTAPQVRAMADVIQRYGDDGSGDITTRQNLQLRGIRFEDFPAIFKTMDEVGLTSMQSGMDNVRNLTTSPVVGIDPDELIDTRELVQKTQDAITDYGKGNRKYSNLPRKFNIAYEGGRDNSIHAEINDLAFVPAYREGVLGFNVHVGGYLSAQRAQEALDMGVWVPPNDEAVDLCEAILTVYTENGLEEGLRTARPKARLFWLMEKWGMELFRERIEAELGRSLLSAAPGNEICQEKKDHLGVHPQKQEGMNYIGLHVPSGRFNAENMHALADLAEAYGNGEIRLTVEQNVIIPFIPDDRIEALMQEPLLQTFKTEPATLERSIVSCTGASYCNFAIIETKMRALEIARELDAKYHIPERVRMHWTGCPNSCGQAQAGDIGLMGTKTKKDGKSVDAVKLFLGGQVGKDAKLGELVQKGVPCEDLPEVLGGILEETFGATLKSQGGETVTPETQEPVAEAVSV
ncbi:MAG: ferredoxin--nitrite reductase [Cyanophyceae cyanobacterium]